MALLKRLFGSGTHEEEAPSLALRFGRFSDVYRTERQNKAFDQAVVAFGKADYLTAYQLFFEFLRHPAEQNLEVSQDNGRVQFELYQGSRRVEGFADQHRFYAISKIAKVTRCEPSFMRLLLDQNFELKYCRFALTPENEIAIITDGATADSSPYKLYPALKELALFADKNDDLLLDEFEALKPVDTAPVRYCSEGVKKVRYEYIVSQLRRVLALMDAGSPDPQRYAVGYSFLLLYTLYKLDYLTKPEGYLMEAFEKLHRIAFRQDGNGPFKKNQDIRMELERILRRSPQQFFNELYDVRSTFGITGPIEHQKLALIIEQELPQMNWYADNGFEDIALAVPGYIVAHSLFYYTLPPPVRELFHLYLLILEAEYFSALGIPSLRNGASFHQKAIRRAVAHLTDQFRTNFPQFNPDTRLLDFSSLPQFAASFLKMVQAAKV